MADDNDIGGLNVGELAMTTGIVLLVIAALLAIPQVRTGLATLLAPTAP